MGDELPDVDRHTRCLLQILPDRVDELFRVSFPIFQRHVELTEVWRLGVLIELRAPCPLSDGDDFGIPPQDLRDSAAQAYRFRERGPGKRRQRHHEVTFLKLWQPEAT